ncbi:hypothetical protein [Rhodocista pekingensis]|uniref:Uncharacterized protein n=1 Tax=Rhodocista pekingensis TaxID=201185 RepID=A0ABW2KXL8_9PROT
MQRAFSHIANGVLLYAIFYALCWALVVKTALLLPVYEQGDSLWARLDSLLMPFATSMLAAFLAHAGLRLTLKRLKLRLSTSESSASLVFLGVLTVLSFGGALGHVFEGPESGPGTDVVTPLSIVLGAWAGVAWRRRLRL